MFIDQTVWSVDHLDRETQTSPETGLNEPSPNKLNRVKMSSKASPDKSDQCIAFCGTRGLPANHGGFETAVDEISKRFLNDGIPCDVFCRTTGSPAKSSSADPNLELVYVAGSRHRILDTFASSIQTGMYLWRHRRRYSHILWFNNANLPGILMTALALLPMSINTDGLEWRRAKWSWPFKMYYFLSSALVCLLCRSLVSDSRSIQNYYRQVFKRSTSFIPYGVPSTPTVTKDRQRVILKRLSLQAGQYFLQITRIEPDNLPLEIARGFAVSGLGDHGCKMVTVGYKDNTCYARQLIAYDGRMGINVREAIYDAEILYTLRKNCFCYVHGNSVGGTNPALLEAMAVCPRVLALDCHFSHEVLESTGMYFDRATIGRDLTEAVRSQPTSERMQQRIASFYQWDAVAKSYRNLCLGDKAAYMPVQEQPESTFAGPLVGSLSA